MQCLPNKQRIKGKKEHALTKQNGAKWCGEVVVWGGGWGSRPWVGGGHRPGSCSGWLSWSGWHPQFSSARTLRLFFGLWRIPSWCNGQSFGHELQYRSWGLLVSPLVYVHSVWLWNCSVIMHTTWVMSTRTYTYVCMKYVRMYIYTVAQWQSTWHGKPKALGSTPGSSTFLSCSFAISKVFGQ